MPRPMLLSYTALALLLACTGGGSTGGGEAKTGGGEAPAAPASAGLALGDIAGTWYIAENIGGKQASRDWCEASRRSVEVSKDQITVNVGQEELVYAIGSANASGDALQIQATMAGSPSPSAHTVRYADASKKVLVWQEPGGEFWRLEHKETLAADGRFLKACCAGPEGEIGEEYDLVPESQACPPAPAK